MKSQFYAEHPQQLTLRWGEPLRLQGRAGELRVLSGRVWLTRQGDLEDHLLEAGQRMLLTSDDVVVLEPWQRSECSGIAWRPDAQTARFTLALRREPAVFASAGFA